MTLLVTSYRRARQPPRRAAAQRGARRALRCGAIVVALGLLVGGCGDEDGNQREGVDLTVDRPALVASLALETRLVTTDDCALAEGAVAAPGERRLLRFDTIVVNRGSRDLVLGDPAHPLPPFDAGDFEFSPCHGHFHLRSFADYELRRAGERVAFGHKQAFCVRDSLPYAPVPGRGYACDFQGISAGWGDAYPARLDGQWVDVTDVPAGDYDLVVTVNPDGRIAETGSAPNVARVPVHLPAY
jgi:hypothetical protein